jgi:hydrogenase maturation protease
MQLLEANHLGIARSYPALPESAGHHACLIAGLGNSLLRDDGIGVHAIRELIKAPPAGALLLEVGTDVFSAVSWLESVSHVLVIDAMDAGGAPGTLYRCATEDVQVNPLWVSLHELGLLSVLEFVPKSNWPEITVLGVQPAVIDYGLELSPVLEASLPSVVEAVRAIVTTWGLGWTRPLNFHVPICQAVA